MGYDRRMPPVLAAAKVIEEAGKKQPYSMLEEPSGRIRNLGYRHRCDDQ
jgi:hypothetical protein